MNSAYKLNKQGDNIQPWRTPFPAEKTMLGKGKWEKSEKVGVKLNIQKTKVMASGPITPWEIDGETVSDFIFGAPKSLQMMIVAMKLKDTYSLEEKLWPT